MRNTIHNLRPFEMQMCTIERIYARAINARNAEGCNMAVAHKLRNT